MKFFKKISTVICAVCLAVSSVGCVQVIDDLEEIGDREVVSISLFAGGYGTEWMDNFLAEYNKTSEDFYFSRRGDNKDEITQITQEIKAGVSTTDIFFAGEANMSELLASPQYIEDLSDVYEAVPEGESKPIKDKIKNYSLIESLYSGKNGEIYALPYYEGTSGIIYDHDFFAENDLFFKDPTTENGLSKGIDGKEGTYDDGLPSTENEFSELMFLLSEYTTEPIIFSGNTAAGVIEPIAETLYGTYIGEASYKTSFTLNGPYYTGSGDITLTPQDAYKIWSDYPEGRIKAFEFIEKNLLNPSYLGDYEGRSHTEAQGKFIMSHADANTRHILLYSGFWWENESKAHFASDRNVSGEGYGYGERDFRILPIPQLNGQCENSNGINYLTSHRDGVIFVRKQQDERKLVAIKNFLIAYASDKQLIQFAETTSTILPYKVEIPESVQEKMTPFGRNLLEVTLSENTVILHPDMMQMATPIADNGFTPERWMARINSRTLYSMYEQVDQFTLEEYARDIRTTYTATNWEY